MAIHNDIITLSKREVAELIDRECGNRLGMSAKEFLQKRREGELSPSPAVHDIEMLLKLA